MAPSYPTALRWKVVILYLRGFPTGEIAERLVVGKTFVKKIKNLFQNTGSVEYRSRRKKSGSLRGVEILFIRNLLDLHPELYLDELQEWLLYFTGSEISISSIHTALEKMGLTWKRVSVIAKERDERRRANYRARIAEIDSSQFVFADESSKDERTFVRRYGRSLQGRRISRRGNFTRGTRYSVFAAISSSKVLVAHAIKGAYNKTQFEYVVETYLLPHLGSFARGEPCSVLVLDNCAIHYSARMFDMIRNKGAIVMFLPPYSPDMNPIEEAFNCAKLWLKRNKDICEMYPRRCFEIALEKIPTESCREFYMDCGYFD